MRTTTRLRLTRAQILSFRRRVQSLDERLPHQPGALRRAAWAGLQDSMPRAALLGAERMAYGAAGRALGEPANRLRYATLTDRVRIRWDGARQPTIWIVPPPEIGPSEARIELARRYLHVFGPATAGAFAAWAGIAPPVAVATFGALGRSLTPVGTPIGDEWILASDEPLFRERDDLTAAARLLPSGDAYFLFQRVEERALLVEDGGRRSLLWTSRVWPGALLVDGAIAGTWRRAGTSVSIEPWHRLSRAERQAVDAEVASLPLHGMAGGPN